MQEAQTIQYYTLEEAKQIIKVEEKERREEQKKEAIYYLKQKLSGFVIVAIGVITPILTKDLTASVFCLPLGFGLMVTKEKYMDFKQ